MIVGAGITGPGSLVKIGTNKATLTGALGLTGTTYINQGTLALNAPAPAGLFEGWVSSNGTANSANYNGPDTVSPIPGTSIQSVARWGASNATNDNSNGPPNMDPSAANPLQWPNNTTIGYKGYIDNTSSAPITYTFGKEFDDGAFGDRRHDAYQ